MTHNHMHDQIRNRVDEIFLETKSTNWSEVMQNITTLGILGVFFLFGLPH